MKTTTTPRLLSAGTLVGDSVKNTKGEDLGKIEEIMLNVNRGDIAYAVVSFGGFMGMGDKLFALPWQTLNVDTENHCLVLDVPKERLENAPGFDKDNWPNFADTKWQEDVHRHYGADVRF